MESGRVGELADVKSRKNQKLLLKFSFPMVSVAGKSINAFQNGGSKVV